VNAVPEVDVIMSTLNEENDIADALDSVLDQTIPLRVTIVDGGSSDRTVAILRARARIDPRIAVIADGRGRSLPEALNLALENTSHPFVAKVDARTFIAPDFLERSLDILREGENANAACVGGQPEQFGTTPFGEAVARARTTRFGVGGSGYADRRERADVDSVQCGVYRRSALAGVGNFDPLLQYGEDEELNWRLRRAGFRIVRDAGIRFAYATRSSWPAAFRQYRNYGRARVAVAAKHPEFARPHHLVPAAALLAGAVLLVAAPVSRRARFALGAAALLYGAAAAAASVRACGPRVGDATWTVAAFTALHAGYGLGVLEGSAAPAFRRTRSVPRPGGLRDHPPVSEGSSDPVAGMPTVVV
jgi:succinoglycan biosynthesis protein ExoA